MDTHDNIDTLLICPRNNLLEQRILKISNSVKLVDTYFLIRMTSLSAVNTFF